MDNANWTTTEDVRREGIQFRVPIEVDQKIKKVHQRLPGDVRQFVDENCQFISIEPDNGMTLHSLDYPESCWLIVLGSDIDEKRVAHEIAHAFLGHRGPVTEKASEKEKEAWDLVRKWGFSTGDIDKNKKQKGR